MGRIYLAGKLRDGESDIASFGEELEDRGHEITFKWWDPNLAQLPIPYHTNRATSAPAAVSMTEAVETADTAVILFPSPKILGAAVEFGIALGSIEENPDREILVVGYSPNAQEFRQSVFYAHPAVIVLRSLAHVRERPWY